MSVIQVNDFKEIDFVNINPAEDIIELPDGRKFKFSDSMCHFCWTGGTVMETIEDESHFYCILCENELTWRRFVNDFLEPKGDKFNFLLPEKWNKEKVEAWYEDYKLRRLEEEQVRKRILEQGK